MCLLWHRNSACRAAIRTASDAADWEGRRSCPEDGDGPVTRPARFTQSDLTRAVKAAEKAGLCVAGYEIRPDGTIKVLTGNGEPANDRNPLDRVLNR